MQHFKYLDDLLKKRLDLTPDTVKDQAEKSPFYISASEVNELLETSLDIELPALDALSQRLQLTEFEKNVLLLTFAVEIDPKYEKIYAYIQDDLNKKYPTPHLVSLVLENEMITKKEILQYFSIDSKLSRLHLFEYKSNPSSYLAFQQILVVSDSLRTFLLENFQLDPVISDFCSFTKQTVPYSNNKDQELEKLIANIQEDQTYIFNIVGASNTQNIYTAQLFSLHLGFKLLRVQTRQIPNELATKELFEILLRDALLSNSLLFFEEFESFLEKRQNDEKTLFLQLAQLSWISFFSTSQPWKPLSIPLEPLFITIQQEQNSFTKLQEQWVKTLEPIDEQIASNLAPSLACHFKFTLDKMNDVAKLLYAKKSLGFDITDKDIFNSCRFRLESNFETYAKPLVSEHTFHDIILPSEQTAQLKNILSHYKNQETVFDKWNFQQHFQSRGLSVLFSGPSGTGKTLAASIVANSLGLGLYRVELSKLVSKYIGETEKNLSRVFDIAEESGVVLFFDEADAIFGKRSETKDAHDRYANIEVSYLLQKIEEYDGLVILASNFKNNIDEAFMRRMRFIVEFSLPNEKEREAIWKKMFTKESNTKNIDFSFVSKHFKLSGANIRNAALYAAFNAVESQKTLNIHHIIDGIKQELQKIAKPLKEKDLEIILETVGREDQ